MTDDPSPAPSGNAGGLWGLLALYVLSLLAAAVVTPLIYWAMAAWAQSGTGAGSELATYLVGKELPRWFDRLRWLFVLLGLPWLWCTSGLAGRGVLGLRGGRNAWRAAGGWLVVGLVMVGAIGAGQLGAGIATLEPEATVPMELAAGIGLGLLSAALIAFFEELVFRGVVLRLCLDALRPRYAIPLAAAIFAFLHFQRVPGDEWPEGTPVTWASGFRIAWRTVTALPETVDPAIAAALFLAGAILCLVTLRHGTLLAPMGLHAGWVWAAALHRRFLDAAAVAPGVRFWGGDDLMEGVLPLLLLTGLLGFLLVRARPEAAARVD